MSRVLVTFAIGSHRELLEIALPSFRRFADLHGYDLLVAELKQPLRRPASWLKLPVLKDALTEHEEAVWLDADIVVVDPADDFPVPPSAWQALVVHATQAGEVPNLGVWVVRRPMLAVLDRMWQMTGYIHHVWWEQAALTELMGYRGRPSRLVQPTELYERTCFLDAGWNVHVWDRAKAEHERIMHATMYADRAAVMRDWAKNAEAVS